MSSIDIIVQRESAAGRLAWVRLPARDIETSKPTKAPRDARYRVRYRTPGGASRTRTFDRKIDAERFLSRTEHAKDVGEFVDPAAGRLTFGESASSWLTRKQTTVKPTTAEMYAAHVRKHLVPAFEALQLRAITTSRSRRSPAGCSPASRRPRPGRSCSRWPPCS